MASSLPVQRLTGDAWWARVARQLARLGLAALTGDLLYSSGKFSYEQ